MRTGASAWKAALVVLLVASVGFSRPQTSAAAAAGQDVILKAADVEGKLLPDRVFFRGQTAPTQGRNSGGVKYGDGFLVFAGLVDSSGYSTGLREKYQAYLVNEVPIEIGGQTLKPGAYGIGFINDNKFIVMDMGANEVLTATSTKDSDMKRPVPLQFVAGSSAGNYKLYHLRDYVEFHRVK